MKHSEKCVKVIVFTTSTCIYMCLSCSIYMYIHCMNMYLKCVVQTQGWLQWLVAHLKSLYLVRQSVVRMMVVLVRQSVVWMMVVLVWQGMAQ